MNLVPLIMKTFLLHTFLFATFLGFSQNGNLNGTIVFYEDDSPVPGLKLELIDSGNTIYESQTDFDGKYDLKNIPVGTYDLKMSYPSFRTLIVSLQIDPGNKMLDSSYPAPCPKMSKACPNGHKNNIIPIVYGLPDAKTMKKSKKGKIKLGGCDPSFCERWHCKTHAIDF